MFSKKVNLKQLDRIILKEKDLKIIDDKLRSFLSNNTSLVNKVKEMDLKVSPKGTYELKFDEDTENDIIAKMIVLAKKNKNLNMDEILTQFFYYDFEGKELKVGELDREGNLYYLTRYDSNLNYLGTQVFKKDFSGHADIQFKAVTENILLQITNFMRYSQLMDFLNKESALIKKQTYIRGFQPKKPTKKEREREARKRVSVSKPKVDYDYNEAEREGEKRSYERVTESWEVGGHWRTYKKSGKRVFVKGYKKGIGSVNKKGKDFTL